MCGRVTTFSNLHSGFSGRTGSCSTYVESGAGQSARLEGRYSAPSSTTGREVLIRYAVGFIFASAGARSAPRLWGERGCGAR